MQSTPYGSWISPISPQDLTSGSVGLGSGTIENGITYWTESRPDQGGRTSLWCEDADGGRRELTPEHYVRTMVHEYGGGAWAVRDGIVVFSTHPTHQCFVLRDGRITPLTPADGTLRYADFQIVPRLGIVLAVREDHRASDLDCVNEIVALKLDSDNADGGTVVRSGADFYAGPRMADDGVMAWIEWDHPNMPWDHTRLMVGAPNPGFQGFSKLEQAAGGESAPCHPTWVGDELFFLDDPSGFWNHYKLRGGELTRLHDDEHDYCYPAWVFGSPYSVLPDGRIVTSRLADGRMQLGYLETDGTFTPDRRETAAVEIGGNGDGAFLAAISWPDKPPTLERVDATTGDADVLRRGFELDLDPGSVSIGRSRTWESEQGPVQAWFYAPKNAAFIAPAGERPPLRVLVHGGPTGMTHHGLRLAIQFWTTRGFAVLDVNYGGSAGFGRAYRERLRGQWGVVDVRDCVDGARELAASGLVDGDRLAIEGGSAGGYTTLAALTMSDEFDAGNSLFGIADLQVFAADTHKFESRYLVGLLGGTPDEVPDVYRDRSPLTHLDRLSCPMLIQQGEDDRIVPPNQAELMADAVRAKGLPVALVMFAGEGHGWRKAETIVASLEAALSFYGQVFGFEPYGVPKLEVENLAR